MNAGSLTIINGRIWTGALHRPWARSITIRRGRVITLDDTGSEDQPVIDARGRTIAPGLTDAHLHLLAGAKSLQRLDISSVSSRDEFEAQIEQRHSHLPQDQWLIAFGWSQENWGGDSPDKTWLAAAGDRPVVCYRMDMHVALVNDEVLRMCDLTREPEGGRIVRDHAGNPTGLMVEAAAWQLVNPLVPEPTVEQRREHLRSGQRYLHSLGLTAVGSMEYAQDVKDVYAPLRDSLTLRSRITLLDREWPDPSMPFDLSFARTFRNDDQLAVIGCKSFIDGTLGSRTARMLREYDDDPGNRGMLVELAARGMLHDWARAVASAGLSPSMHAIGDEAARLALDVLDGIDPAARTRIEHAQQLDPGDIPRFRGRIASMQPLHKADDCRYVRRRLGDRRLAGTFAFRSLQEAGAVLAFGSDWPVVSPDPLLGMRVAITGVLLDGQPFLQDQNLTVEQALRAYTQNAAYALQLDDAGVLKPGSLGDLVMFDSDPFTADWVNRPPRIVMTIAGGNVVYDVSRESWQGDPRLPAPQPSRM